MKTNDAQFSNISNFDNLESDNFYYLMRKNIPKWQKKKKDNFQNLK